MAPYANTRTRTRARARARARGKPKATKEPRRTHFKKQQVKSKNIKEASMVEDLPSYSSTNSSANCLNIDHEFDFEGVDISTTSTCSTPKAQRFRIPKIETCPPAPKKQRVISNCSLQRRPIAFFAPPDLELFFFFALGDISV